MQITINCQNPSFLPYLTGKAEWYINNMLNKRKKGTKLLFKTVFIDADIDVYIWHNNRGIKIEG